MRQNLAIFDRARFATIPELFVEGAFSLPDGTEILTKEQVAQSLERLVAEGSVESDGTEGFRLTDDAHSSVEAETQRSQELFDRVIEKHLTDARGGLARNRDVFVGAVATIFAELGETYVRLILGDVREVDFARGPLVQRVLRDLDRRTGECDVAAVKAGVVAFIEDLTPDAAHVKWNLAQNYYVAKALGLDVEGRILSEEAFGDAEIFLDTNIVLPALEPLARHHSTFQSLAAACRGMASRLLISQPTVEETQASASLQREVLEKVIGEVPRQLEGRVASDLFRIAMDKVNAGDELDLGELFAPYEQPGENLRTQYDVEIVDDPWFESAADTPQIETLSRVVSEAWKRRTGRSKPPNVALHDALLLGWVAKRRQENPDKTIIIVTRDHTLPDVRVGDEEARPAAMTIDAFLQWVSPVVLRNEPEVDFSAIFADAIKYELLPQENFFDPKDFLVFHEMEMSCKELPAEDVEKCLLHIKKTMPELDPRRAEDRERLTAAINRFLVTPGRKYQLELERLEREKADVQRAARKERDEDRRRADAELRDRDEKLDEASRRIERFEEQAETRARQEKRLRLRRSGMWRLGILVTLLLLAEFVVFREALSEAAAHESVLEVVGEALPVAGAVLGAFVMLGWFLLDRERIDALGWPVRKVFKA